MNVQTGLLLAFLLAGGTVTAMTPPQTSAHAKQVFGLATRTTTRDIYSERWSNFIENHVRAWRGIWTRFYPSGRVRAETRSERRFELGFPERGTDFVNQTNTYENPDWTSNGETVRRWYYRDGDPPIWVSTSPLTEESVAPPVAWRLIFLPEGDGLWRFTNIVKNETFFYEVFLIHPADPSIRLSIASVYSAGEFQYTAYAREKADVNNVTAGGFWTTDNTAVKLRDPVCITGCYRGFVQTVRGEGYRVTRRDGVLAAGFTVAPSSNGYVTLKLPDDVYITVPKEIGKAAQRRRTTFDIVWLVGRYVVTNSMKWAKDGSIISETTSKFRLCCDA
eukprot:CAMPEP_0198723882 /NCGR_PEP_ID=MMETSP1475-20131203/1391_1 /TAXON_ID= ORGANISM="Unidentified sp., Strain CCMP1999" /NCGR_SAMPLE_ID=MMETSP1475 /ASSEMBLY_ACC=CAM_ASM_001111 /LENGTH=333 /DNA_ID=CAMNT_0044485203 /DNA_START=335 /DNA_END=1336 /DNA_ORIENTATION=+